MKTATLGVWQSVSFWLQSSSLILVTKTSFCMCAMASCRPYCINCCPTCMCHNPLPILGSDFVASTTSIGISPAFENHKRLMNCLSIDTFTINVWLNFDKMQMTYKVITGSSGHAFLWERTVLHSMETVVGHWSGSLRKCQSQKRYLLQYAKVPYVT